MLVPTVTCHPRGWKVTWFPTVTCAFSGSHARGTNIVRHTYTPVACLASSRAIIAMANRLNLELHQVDIKGAYLNGELQENKVLYMQHLPGYKSSNAGKCVLHLVKTLYSLKQSGCCWYQKLSSIFSLGLG